MSATQTEATAEMEARELRRSPLEAIHLRDGATLVERDNCLVPLNYGDAMAEYGAVREGVGAGLIDLSSRGRVRLRGSEVAPFLNGMITNDMKTLQPAAWMPAIFPNVQGRMIASARVVRVHEAQEFFVDTEAATYAKVLQTLERFRFAGDFHVEDATQETAQLSLQGAGAQRIVNAVFGERAANIEPYRAAIVEHQGAHVTILRATHTNEDGFDFILSASDAPALWDELKRAGAKPCGFEAFDVLRIEAGAPRFGVDMDERNVALETGLDDAVSYTKGCYVGQEIIARIHWRGHVAKRLAGLIFDERTGVPSGAKVKTADASKEIGRVTSSVFSPRIGKTVALALIKYDYLAPETETLIALDEEMRAKARVVALPFVQGSWQAGAKEI